IRGRSLCDSPRSTVSLARTWTPTARRAAPGAGRRRDRVVTDEQIAVVVLLEHRLRVHRVVLLLTRGTDPKGARLSPTRSYPDSRDPLSSVHRALRGPEGSAAASPGDARTRAGYRPAGYHVPWERRSEGVHHGR